MSTVFSVRLSMTSALLSYQQGILLLSLQCMHFLQENPTNLNPPLFLYIKILSIDRRRLTSHYHGSKISGPQQSFLTATSFPGFSPTRSVSG